MKQTLMTACLGMATLCATPLTAFAQASGFPDKPVHMIVPFPAGGDTDILARLLAKRLSISLAQPVVVDNVPGAAATLGAGQAARAKPDGYTIFLGVTASNAIAPALYAKLSYDPVKDFVPIAELATFGNAIVASPQVPANNMAEFVTWAKSHPESAAYGSWGIGSAGHLAMEMVKTKLDLHMVHVPYKGVQLALNDVLANQIPIAVTGILVADPFYKSGKIKVLAVTGSARAPIFPNVQTLKEQGIPFAADSWYALFAPVKVPADALARLRTATEAIRNDPEFKKTLVSLGLNPSTASPAQFAKSQERDVKDWAELVKLSGAKLD